MTPSTPEFASGSFDPASPYRRLARSLDALPNRFPPADDESDLYLLAEIFTPEEAGLAADLHAEYETPAQISQRLGRDPQAVSAMLKEMVRKGLIAFGKTPQGRPGFGLLPFVVGIYEAQVERMNPQLAQRFETYFKQAFGGVLKIQPQVHRVIPVGVSIKNNMEVQPFESVSHLLDQVQSWGVIDCICRTQKALIGQPCGHPRDVCMVLSQKPGAFEGSTSVRALTRAEAAETLLRAAQAGLVHCVSNNQRDLWYICNCCTCSCGVLRGMAELGIANVVARSAFINRVDEDRCIGCGECVPVCPFGALALDEVNPLVRVNEVRCVGCGVCVLTCSQDALGLERRPGEAEPPASEADWRAARQSAA